MTSTIPAPFHRWAANEDADVTPMGLHDFCLDCGAKRNPLAHLTGTVALAQCPCPAHVPVLVESARKAAEQDDREWAQQHGEMPDERVRRQHYRWWLRHDAGIGACEGCGVAPREHHADGCPQMVQVTR